MIPFPVGGLWRLDVKMNCACHVSVVGIEYCRLRTALPATGVEATRLARASSGFCPTRSICGDASGTAFPKTRLIAPMRPDCPFSVNDALIRSRYGLNFAVSLI